MLDFQNVKADVLLVGHHLDKARTLLTHGNPAIPGLLDGEFALRRDEAATSIAQAIHSNGNLLAMLREREKAYQKKADAIDV